MSVGTVDPTQPPPFDPNAQDPAKVQAMLAAPPPPVAIPDAAPPIAPPAPALGPIDVPQSPAAFTPPDSSAIAKSMTAPAIASALPGATPSAPGAPSTPAATPDAPTAPSQTDDLKKAQDEEAKARDASDKAQLDLQKSQQPSVEEKNQLLQQQVDHLKASQAEQQKQRDQFETAQLAANDQLKQTQDLVKKFKYRDYFSNEDGSTNWGLKIGSALAAGLGAYGAGLTHGPNYALQILNKNMDDWHASQLDHLNQLKDEEVSQRTGIQDAQLARQKAQSDLTLKDAGFDKLIASQLDAAAARQSSASFAPSLTAAAAKLKLDAAEKETAAKKLAVELNLKLGDEERKRRLDEASIGEKNAQAGLALAKTGKVHGAGSGGVGGISATGANAEELAKRIREGKDGRALTDDEIIHAATELHIPLAGKTGTVTLDKVRSVAKFDADAARKDAASGIKGNDEVNKFVRTSLNDDKGLTKELEVKREVTGALGKLKPDKDGLVNGVNFQQAVDATVKAATGLGARPGSIAVFQSSLGGLWDRVMRSIQHAETGQYTAHDVQVLTAALKKQQADNAAYLKERMDSHRQEFESNPVTKGHKDIWESALKSRVGMEQPHGADAPGTIRVQNGHKFQLGTDGKWQAL